MVYESDVAQADSYTMAWIRKRQLKNGDARRIVFLIVDDTYCKKDRTTKKMEALSFQYSHKEGKSV
jgi:hypothetical protein